MAKRILDFDAWLPRILLKKIPFQNQRDDELNSEQQLQLVAQACNSCKFDVEHLDIMVIITSIRLTSLCLNETLSDYNQILFKNLINYHSIMQYFIWMNNYRSDKIFQIMLFTLFGLIVNPDV